MIIDNVCAEVSFGTVIFFVFLLFCFMNVQRTKAIKAMRYMMLSCIFWLGGDLCICMQVWPGTDFWYGISVSGLIMIPPFIYYFLFDVIGLKKEKLISVFFAISAIVGFSYVALGAAITVMKRMDALSGAAMLYAGSKPVYILVLLEAAFMLYITVLAHFQIGDRLYLRGRLAPLLFGSVCVLAGKLLDAATGGKYPYSSFGGLILALCVVHLLSQRHLFDISQRLLVGVVYMVAATFIIIPIWFISRNLMKFAELMKASKEVAFFLAGSGIIIWALSVIFLVFTLSKRMEKRQSEEEFEWLQQTQERMLSLLDVEELGQMVITAVSDLVKDAGVELVIRNNSFDNYFCISSKADLQPFMMTQCEMEKAYAMLEEEENAEAASVHYDDMLQGYLCLKADKKPKMSYMELECIQQLASHISICMKNIYIYQTRYQMTIHDELTGLYNRRYFKECLEKKWGNVKRGSLIYMDIDNFKLFNELYGENCGDEILKWCAKILMKVIVKPDVIFRMGSNEYIIYTGESEKNKLLLLAKEIQSSLLQDDAEKPKVLQPITMSIGIATCTNGETGFEKLLKQAERASFFAKEKGRNRIEVYGETDISREEKVKNISAYEQVSSTVNALTAAINARDSYTFAHSMHVSQYAVMLAKELGLDSNEIRIVKEAGLLHDIGKIGIPDHILQKEGKLTEKEYKVMKSHVAKSVEMIHFLPNMNYVIPAVISHHERYDGKGYPRGLKGEQIPLLGRILAVCDCYDAMTSKRSYKEAFSKEYAMEELRKNSGTQFDPDIADVFITLIPYIKDMDEVDKVG